MDGTGSLFSDFISALPKGSKALVVAYPPNQPLGYAELETLVSAQLPSQPYILVGESFSGPIAIALAAAAPAGLHGVVLVCSFAKAPVPAVLGALLSWLPLWRAPARLAAAALLGRHSSPSHRERLSAAMGKVSTDAWRARLRAALSVDAVSKLKAVKVPLLYLRAASDRVVPRSAWNQIKRSLPAARLAEVDGPHFLLQAKPVECAAQVTAFAKEVGFAL
jgi:pimeloyl-ACP methyl ester carboxylesterase